MLRRQAALIGCTAFKQECSMLYTANGIVDLAVSADAAVTAGEYDRAIGIYSAAIDMDFATYAVFANRSKAGSESAFTEIWRAGKKHLEHARMNYSQIISGSQGRPLLPE
ncbi:hypothetical protein C8R48DRAFT_776064 [Suillus tomentosus]|nr:hypothetical protein C8R48DRAFT_776064 [Suillus tomentosus]